MSTTYEVIYYPSQGRAEAIRLMLALAGQPFTNRAVGADWATQKLTMPLHQVPVLVVRDEKGERMIPQSQAIVRHLARTFGFYGKNETEMLQADIVAETAHDVAGGLGALVYGPGKNNAEMQAKHLHNVWPVLGGRLVKLLSESPAQEGFFVGATPTFADVLVFQTLTTHLALWPTCLDAMPTLQAFYTRMSSLPQLAAHLKARPQNEGVAARA